jgi:alkanesulfonate monooxygenase SsuD/methylene tetrahydromethanopterin reductase-like flavin-dependent oxidoreductase (luciferase family)
MARNVLKRVVAWGDGWLPNRVTPAQVQEGRKIIDALAGEAGRDPASITISVYGEPPDPRVVADFVQAGADRVVVRPERVDGEEAMSNQLERMAAAVLR